MNIMIPAGQGPGTSMVSAPTVMTNPMGNTKGEPKYYACTLATASFHRPDGKKLPFLFGFLATEFLEDQAYLDNEVEGGNPFISYATPEQTQHAQMRMDPRGTLRREIEAELRVSLEAKIREELEASMTSKVVVDPNAPAPVPVVTDAEKVGGIDAVQRIHDALHHKDAIRSGTATVAPALKPVSTADIKSAAAESGV